jgi:hypothetical protein
MKKTILSTLLFVVCITPVLADYKIKQRLIIEDGMGVESTVYVKGVRERKEAKMSVEDPEVAAMMGNMGMSAMPVSITQCDQKQNVSLNEAKKLYFIDYYDYSGLKPEQRQKIPAQKLVIKGTMTVESLVTDSGKRQQMFGLTAKWLKFVSSVEVSADSCDGKSSIKIEQEGWFVDLTLNKDACVIPPITGEKGGCRPKMIVKSAQNPGFFLEGTTKMFESGKPGNTTKLETLDLSKATLEQSLFEIPTSYTEVDSVSELMQGITKVDTSAQTVFSDSDKKSSVKTIAIDFFSGNSSKINQDEIRGYISQQVSSAGFSGRPVGSQAEISGGAFANVIGVEIKKVKESGASKVGGLFGKVTGSSDATKLGNSSAEVVVTIYGKDGKTVVASSPASAEIKGNSSDAVKAAIDQVLKGLLDKLR